MSDKKIELELDFQVKQLQTNLKSVNDSFKGLQDQVKKTQEGMNNSLLSLEKTSTSAGGSLTNVFKSGTTEFKTFAGVLAGNLATSGLMALGSAAVVVGKQLAETFNVFEAEKIKAINNQFEVLAKNAGLAADTIREELATATDGLADDDDVILAANKAIVALGANASELGKILQVARTSSAAFGGSLVENFERINSAIESGRTKAIADLGLRVQEDEAYRKFAASVGLTVQQLNEEGKQRAILNAILEKSKTAFAGVDLEASKSTNTFERLKVTLGQIGEAATTAFERKYGSTVQTALALAGIAAEKFRDKVIESTGTADEKAEIHLKNLKENIEQLEYDLKLFGAMDASKWNGGLDEKNKELEKYAAQLKAAKAELEALNKVATSSPAAPGTPAGSAPAAGSGGNNRYKANVEDPNAQKGASLVSSLEASNPEKKYEADVVALQAALDAKKISIETYNASIITLTEQKELADAESNQREIDALIAKNEAMTEIDAKKYEDDIAANKETIDQLLLNQKEGSVLWLANKKKIAQDEKKIDAARKKQDQDYNDAKLQATADVFGALGTIAAIGGKKNFEITKAFNLAEAITTGILAVQKASASALPPFNIPAIVSATALSVANVARIASTQPPAFRDGGVIGGFTGASPGPDNMTIQARRGEMFLNSRQQRQLFSAIDGGGVASGSVMQTQLARLVEAIEGQDQRIQLTIGSDTIVDVLNSEIKAGRIIRS